MKAADFYAIFNEFNADLVQKGFVKKTNKLYENNDNIQLQIALDRNGWDDEYGWGFQLWLYDMKDVDTNSYEKPRKAGVIRFPSLISDGYITKDQVNELYASIGQDHPQLMGQVEVGWIAFYAEQDLRATLLRVMPLVVSMASDWAIKAVNDR